MKSPSTNPASPNPEEPLPEQAAELAEEIADAAASETAWLTSDESDANLQRIRWVVLWVLMALACTLVFLIIRPFLLPLLTGMVTAVAFYPVHLRIKERLGRPSLAALVSTLLVIIAIVGPLTYMVTVLVGEGRQAYQSLGPGGFGQGAERLWELVKVPLDRIAELFNLSAEEIRQNLVERLRAASGSILGQSFSFIGAIGGGLLSVVVALGALYFSLKNGRNIYEQILLISPLHEERTAKLLDVATEMIEASVYGVLAVAAAQGLLLWLGVTMAGLGSPGLWGLAAAIGSVIPVVGSAVAWVPAAGILFAQGNIGWGIFMLIWGAGVVGMIDNIVRPWVVSSRRPMNALVVFIVILGAVQAFGVVGVLAGPVILAVTIALFDIVREELHPGAATPTGADGPSNATNNR